MLRSLDAAATHYRSQGFAALRYKAVPYIYHSEPAQDDVYALHRMGAVRYLCTLSSVIDLADPPQLNKLRRRQIKKSSNLGVEVLEGPQQLTDYWSVLQEVLAARHAVKPAHSLHDIQTLVKLFPDSIWCLVARHHNAVVAGTVLFRTARVDHTQYLASNAQGRDLGALDLVIKHAIDSATAHKRKYFSFGISMQDSSLNDGLFWYKHSFGAGAVIHEFYECKL